VYPKVSRLAAWSNNCKRYSSLPLVQLYRYFLSQYSEFCRHNPLCFFSTSVYFCKHISRYRLSPETSAYTLVLFYLVHGTRSSSGSLRATKQPRNFPPFMAAEGSLPCTQQPAAGPYLSQTHSQFSLRFILLYTLSVPYVVPKNPSNSYVAFRNKLAFKINRY